MTDTPENPWKDFEKLGKRLIKKFLYKQKEDPTLIAKVYNYKGCTLYVGVKEK